MSSCPALGLAAGPAADLKLDSLRVFGRSGLCGESVVEEKQGLTALNMLCSAEECSVWGSGASEALACVRKERNG